MKKQLLLVAALASAMWLYGTTDNEYICEGGSVIDSDLCLPINGSVTVSFAHIDNLSYFRWIPLGDLDFETGSSDTDSTVIIKSTGYGKGTIRLQYRTGGCTSASTVDVFKSFELPNTFSIAGPTCVATGDVVVYSVDPILTVNLAQNIGIDNYYWNINDSKPDFVDSIYYTAGDGSSITFKVGTLGDNDVLSVNLGQCNKDDVLKRVSLVLGKRAPTPIVPIDTCVEYGTAPFSLAVQNAVEGVTYTWEAPSNFNLSAISGNSVVVTPDNASSGEIKVTASYTDEPACSESSSTIKINRKWGTSTSISSNTSCVEVEADKYYKFQLEGQIPTNTKIQWELPVGWTFKPNTAQNGQTIEARPLSDAALTGVLKAWSSACPSETVQNDTVSYTVHVIPASINSIYGDDCLRVGQTYKFWIDTMGVRPAARSYTWTAPGCDLTTYTGDTVYITPTIATTYLRVTPNGDGCNAAYAQRTLAFLPTAPESIVMQDACIASNMPDTITLSLSGILSNQTYDWVLPTGWSMLASNEAKTQISVRTTGVVGTHTISAFAVGTSACGNSDTISSNVAIAAVSGVVSYSAALEAYSVQRNIAGHFYWYLLHNGVLVDDDVFENNTTRVASYTDSYYQLGDLANSTEYTIVVELELVNGCRERCTYGAPINSNIEYRSVQRSLVGARQSKTSNMLVSPNPTKDNITISLVNTDVNQPFQIKIVNMNGSVVYEAKNLVSYNVNVSTWPTGQYVVFAYLNDRRLSAKFIKQ
ncbi:MAG: T9SS type A sorting domain-containing protein [Paludibacteraceae bacterium]